jgi:hypothetical protein
MNTTESDNLLEVWDKLCELVDQKGSAVHSEFHKKDLDYSKFNQIKLNRATALWQSIMAVLAPLSEEEIDTLLDLTKPNNKHTVYESKFSIALVISIPIGLFYLINVIFQNFNLWGNDFLSGPVVGCFIGGALVFLFLGGHLLYKKITFR